MRIIAIGKRHTAWITPGVQQYEVRLRPPFTAEWQLLPYSSRQGEAARKEESEAILQRIKPQDYVVLLDETGTMFDSPTLAHTLQAAAARQSVVLVVGGAYGVDARVKQRANIVWSLSRLVFPHMLVRLLLVEQLYRVQEICRGSPYHHQ